MAAEVDPAHVSVVQWSLNMVQPMMSAFQATPATPIELLGVAPITPARKVPCPVAEWVTVSAVACGGGSGSESGARKCPAVRACRCRGYLQGRSRFAGCGRGSTCALAANYMQAPMCTSKPMWSGVLHIACRLQFALAEQRAPLEGPLILPSSQVWSPLTKSSHFLLTLRRRSSWPSEMPVSMMPTCKHRSTFF